MFSEFHILDGGLGSELLRQGIPVTVCILDIFRQKRFHRFNCGKHFACEMLKTSCSRT
jgi:hypothetical protein